MKHSFSHAAVTSLVGLYGKQTSNLTELQEDLDPTKQKKLIKSLGFTKLRHFAPKTLFSDSLVPVAKKAIELANLKPSDIDAIITITQSHDYIVPATSYVIQEHLGLSNNVMVLDGVNGCSAFVNALQQASALVENGLFKHILICAGDSCYTRSQLTKQILNQQNTQNANTMIFGDGASATVVSFSKQEVFSTFETLSHGEQYQNLIDYTLVDFFQCPVQKIKKDHEGLYIDGVALTNYLFDVVVPSIQGLLKDHNLSLDNISYAFAHQGNRSLIKSLAISLGSNLEKVPFLASETGNLSSASIPVMISDKHNELLDLKNKPVILSGFGVGLSVSNAIVDLSKTMIGDVLEF